MNIQSIPQYDRKPSKVDELIILSCAHKDRTKDLMM